MNGQTITEKYIVISANELNQSAETSATFSDKYVQITTGPVSE